MLVFSNHVCITPNPNPHPHMRLLFITQKLHGQDAFGALWANGFVERGYDVTIVCLEWRPQDCQRVLGSAHFPFRVYSLGKERGASKFMQLLRFKWLTWTLPYDRVFIHMAPVWGLLGAPAFVLRRKPTYLWYTHYKMQAGLKLLGMYGKRLFCATEQSLPHYKDSPKKIVVGHGIDLAYWPKRENVTHDPHRLLAVHRLSRSKRLELVLRAMTMLPPLYTLDVYGIEAEPDYAAALQSLTKQLQLEHRIAFHGSAPMKDLPLIYTDHRLILNMASETIDKTMLEAMTCGCYPVTTKGNAEAIGIPHAPIVDTPEAIADFVLKYAHAAPLSPDAMYTVVAERHSLHSLIEKMDRYMRDGL